MGAGHSHSHGHDHSHHGADHSRRLAMTLALVLVYMTAEIIGGLISNSLALLADAGHMLSDAGALVIALVAMRIARRPASPTHTFGYQRAEILAAFANGAALVAIAIVIAYQAITRIGSPPEVDGPLMLVVAAGGLVINLAGLWILRGGKSESLNVRGAWMHVMADTLGSAGAIVSGALVTGMGWNLADPIASLIIATLVLYSAWLLLGQTTAVLMQAVPAGISLEAVEGALASVDGVTEAHDVHVWAVTSGRAVMSAHLSVAAGVDRKQLVDEIHRRLRDELDIHHATIQLDCPDTCTQCRQS